MLNLDEKLMLSPMRDPNKTTLASSPRWLGYTAESGGAVCFRGMPLTLPPKEQAVLHLLLSEWPRTVSKETFAQQVWIGQPMSDESLARCIAQLRHALPPTNGLVLRSVYRHGYCLLVVPHEAGAITSPVHWRLLHTAMALPHQVETLTYARQLMQQRTAEALVRAEGLLRALTAEAPNYTAALLALAECVAVTVSSGLIVRRERIEEALGYLRQVAANAPQMPGVVAEMAHLLDCAWRFEEAASLHEQALADTPLDAATHYYFGWHLLATDRPSAACQALEKALQLNPFSVYMAIMLARALVSAGDHEAALARARRTHKNAPDDRAAALHLLGVQALISPSTELAKRALDLATTGTSWIFSSSTLSYVLARCGEEEEAQRVIASTPINNVSERATHAAALTLLGRRNEALERLTRAADEGCGHLPLVMMAVENRNLRVEACWIDLSSRIWPRS